VKKRREGMLSLQKFGKRFSSMEELQEFASRNVQDELVKEIAGNRIPRSTKANGGSLAIPLCLAHRER
jgi:hypothetical protein